MSPYVHISKLPRKPIYMTFRIGGLIGDLLMSHPIPLLMGDADLVKN